VTGCLIVSQCTADMLQQGWCSRPATSAVLLLTPSCRYADAPEYYGNTSTSAASTPQAVVSSSKAESSEGGQQLMLLTMDLDRPPVSSGLRCKLRPLHCALDPTTA
jgi:hypothetical protein